MTAQQQTAVQSHEQEVKLESYMRDYERLFAENKRLRELGNSLRDEKETALAEVSKLKVASHTRMTEVQDECNLKIAHLEQMLLEQKERHRAYEERAYAVISS